MAPLKAFLAKAFRAALGESAACADTDYWWLMPQVTPWPPPPEPATPDEKSYLAPELPTAAARQAD